MPARAWEPRLETLPAAQRRLWPRLSEVPHRFVLYGGTALALRLEHRRSLDFDFFSSGRFEPGALRASIPFLARATLLASSPDTLAVDVSGVRVSFLGDLNLRVVGLPDSAPNGVRVASIDDLAGTKVKALLDRIEAKDYLDIAALLRAGLSVERIIGDAMAIFGRAFSPIIALKALAAVDDPGLTVLPSRTKRELRAAAAAVSTIPKIRPIRPRI
jgi:hypothetical protein